MTPEEFITRVGEATENDDIEELERLGSYFEEGVTTERPFEPDIRLKGQDPDSPEEGQVAMSVANGWARSYRLVQFRRRLRNGYSGPIVVSEGDSWFQYPWLLRDVIDGLMKPFAVMSLGAAGDTLSNMLAEAEYKSAIADNNADVFLFSASGNDVLGNGDLAKLLHRYAPGMEIDDVIRHDAVSVTLDRIEQSYITIISEALSVRPQLRVFFHGYDRPVPRSDGKWLGRPMNSLGIPSSLQLAIVGALIDKLNDRLKRVEHRFPQGVHHVDCRGRVGASPNSWYDELHPRNPGYSRVAQLFEAQIRSSEELARPVSVAYSHFEVRDQTATLTDTELARLEQHEEGIVDGRSAIAVASHVGEGFGPHLSRLDREILDEYRELLRDASQPDQDQRLRARRYMVPKDDERAFERILGESNLFPVNFLSRGAKKARAVAKVQIFAHGEIPMGSGSGFMVGPGLMLTNNHVISSRDMARRSKAIFDYQDNDRFQPMPTHTFDVTDDVFFTSDRSELDFTFVSVRMDNADGHELGAFGNFTMIEQSGKAIKGEPVSIIQHPRGDRKSIALRDSTIVGVKGDFIYYSTDTEPGSSGAPVLNDQWLPVALHHRSVPHPQIPNKWIANRGIRISHIIAKLRDAAENGDGDAKKILLLIGAEVKERPSPLAAPLDPLRPREDKFIHADTSVADPSGVIRHTEEIFRPDRWDGVDGYDPDFLGMTIPLPLPIDGTGVRDIGGRPDLAYKHFSVVMHADRKLAMVTACNTDGSRIRRLRRSGSWRVDPRIPRDAQVDNDAYRNNDYDRGHLVRRIAPMWGTESDARFAMADTFHYTVCAPQHARLNQRIWLELEDYLLEWAEDHDARLSIFTGPIFRADDPLYRSLVRVPADYWKVAIAQTPAGPRAVGYLHTQKNLIPRVDEAFGDYRTHRVPLHIVAELSGLEFDALAEFDVAGGGFEMLDEPREVRGREDIGF